MQIFRWGKRLVRLLRRLVERPGPEKDDQLTIVPAGKDAIAAEDKEALRRQALERMAARNWTPPVGRFDRDEANERTPSTIWPVGGLAGTSDAVRAYTASQPKSFQPARP
jgi:hypothetical protein